MAEVVWSDAALSDLDAIADYIALEDSQAAEALVRRVFEHVALLKRHPQLGSLPKELKGRRYRQIVEPPCRIFYREDGKRIYILHVIRGERLLRAARLKRRS